MKTTSTKKSKITNATGPSAPFGYTKAGKPRQRPAPNKEGICPVKECRKSFRHRSNPKQAIWQHLNYFFRENCPSKDDSLSTAHRTAHAKLKQETASNFLTENEKKQHQKEASHQFAKRNPELRKRTAALANFKAKAKRHLKRDKRDIEEKVVLEMAENWMDEKFGENWNIV